MKKETKETIGGFVVIAVGVLLFNSCSDDTPKESDPVEVIRESAPLTPEQVEANKLAEEQAAKRKAAAQRKAEIEYQFSGWNGAHIKLERMVKVSMNDPDSYEHVDTSFWDKGDHLVVLMEYRGKNVYGGKVKGFVKAKTDISTGEVLAIIDRG